MLASLGIGARLNRGVPSWGVCHRFLIRALVSLVSYPSAPVAVESEALTAGARVALVALWTGEKLPIVSG